MKVFIAFNFILIDPFSLKSEKGTPLPTGQIVQVILVRRNLVVDVSRLEAGLDGIRVSIEDVLDYDDPIAGSQGIVRADPRRRGPQVGKHLW